MDSGLTIFRLRVLLFPNLKISWFVLVGSSLKMSKYKELTKLSTEYAKRMNYLSNRIFSEVARPTNSKSMKVVKMFSAVPVQKNDYYVNYYPRHVETGWLMRHLRSYGLFRDEHEDFKDEMKRLRALRGKAPPKRGEGKKAKK